MKSFDHEPPPEILRARHRNRPAIGASRIVFEEASAGNPSEAGQSPTVSEISSVKLSDLIPLEQVSRMLPRRTHRSTVFRWAQKGCRGVRLRVVSVGGVKCTTQQWLLAYFDALQQRRDSTAPTSRHDRCRRQSHPNGAPRLFRTREVLNRHGLGLRGSGSLARSDPDPSRPD